MRIKKTVAMLLVGISLFTLCLPASASMIMPFAHNYISSSAVVLGSSKKVGFEVTCKNVYTIEVVSCYIEKKNSNGTWSNVGSVELPSSVTSIVMNKSSNASSLIGTGTYRAVATYSVEGETTTSTSASRTFN